MTVPRMTVPLTTVVRIVAGLCAAWVPIMCRADWPQFRGPAGDGHVQAGTLPLEWSPDKNIVWKKAVPGRAWSSPAVVGNQVFLTTAVPVNAESEDRQDYSLRLLRIDLETGQIELDQEVFRQLASESPSIHDKNSHASPTPIVADNRVHVHFGHQGTACLTRAGRLLWQTSELRYEPRHGNGGSPLLIDHLLIFSCDADSDPFVAALAADTGQVQWKVPRQTDAEKNFSFSTPTLITVDGQRQVISPGSTAVCAYDPLDGRELWRVRYRGYSVVPRPVFGEGLLYVCTGFDTPSLLAIRVAGARGDVTDSHVEWEVNRGVPNTPSVILDNDRLYMVSDRGVASCLDARSGQTVWQQRLGGNFSASPIIAGDRLYFLNEAGKTFVVRADDHYQLLAENDLQEQSLASFAAAGDSLLIRTADHLYRVSDAQ
jgi:outer membrane protein assembly factor BamB